ncbi:hypothetical protein F3K36_30525 [Delftia sp. BR1]|nr:hypothetical protein F3K36_30525 [Delftia sp. BR1]MPT51502.1 hypothetical protein [Delftia sp.]
MKLAIPKARDTEEGPPRTEGVVPLPRSERGRRAHGGRREATQGVLFHLNAGPRWRRLWTPERCLPRAWVPASRQTAAGPRS